MTGQARQPASASPASPGVGRWLDLARLTDIYNAISVRHLLPVGRRPAQLASDRRRPGVPGVPGVPDMRDRQRRPGRLITRRPGG